MLIVIKGTRLIILYTLRTFRLYQTHQWRLDQNSIESETSTKLKIISDPKFLKVVPNTAKVIFAQDKKILSI